MTVSKTTTIGTITVRYDADTVEELVALIAALDAHDAESDDWIEWFGGECPVPMDTIVDVKFRSGETRHSTPARMWRWVHTVKHQGDIIAYRISHD